MENKTAEKMINEEVKEIKEVVKDESEKINQKTKHVVADMKEKYDKASPAMQKFIFAMVVAIGASIITIINMAIFRYCMSSKSDTKNK